jgi:hypothetical protein
MMIKLTYASSKNLFWIRATEVRAVERHPENLLETLVVSILVGPNGQPIVYSVLEPPEEIVEMLEAAYRAAPEGIKPKLNG